MQHSVWTVDSAFFRRSVQRTLEDNGRNCRADVPVAVYLDNAMRSIAEGEREKYARLYRKHGW